MRSTDRSYMHGQRVVFPGPRGRSSRHPPIVVALDFNVHPRRLASESVGDIPEGASFTPCGFGTPQIVRTPDIIESTVVDADVVADFLMASQPFAEDVETHLPYIVTYATVEGKSHVQHFMVDEERLIQLSVRGRVVFSRVAEIC